MKHVYKLSTIDIFIDDLIFVYTRRLTTYDFFRNIFLWLGDS
jgi:hypothetical protein